MNNEFRGSDVTYVLFGSTGNLATLKILPALCALYIDKKLSPGSKIVAFGRRNWNDDDYRGFIRTSLSKFSEDNVRSFLNQIIYLEGGFDNLESFKILKSKITTEKIFYHLAVMPQDYSVIIQSLGETNLKGKLLIEKPFGHNIQSANELQNLIETYFRDEDILRIDHYLGKRALEELKQKKKEDIGFESMLTTKSVQKIVCRLREKIDINGRGAFYDKVGAFLDVGQNHGLEVLATLLAKQHVDYGKARKDIIESLTYVHQSLIRGQYKGYQEEKGVKSGSHTETYFGLKLESRESNLRGIEIILEGGKALEKEQRKEEVVIYFRDGHEQIFDIDNPKGFNAYETVILAALEGRKDMFVGKEEVFALWGLTDTIMSEIDTKPLIYYKKGEGPNFI